MNFPSAPGDWPAAHFPKAFSASCAPQAPELLALRPKCEKCVLTSDTCLRAGWLHPGPAQATCCPVVNDYSWNVPLCRGRTRGNRVMKQKNKTKPTKTNSGTTLLMQAGQYNGKFLFHALPGLSPKTDLLKGLTYPQSERRLSTFATGPSLARCGEEGG